MTTKPVPLTALLTCRNAEATLEPCLRHLKWHGARIIMIDNGSTDRTPEIARGLVDDVRHDPFHGAFDLTRQLRLKAEIIKGIGKGWIIHADADEFIDTPEGTPLSEFLPLWDGSDAVSLACNEIMFLPTSETDWHAPDRFVETMQACIRIEERDPKERVFRASAPLTRWMATGGHTVAASGDRRPTAPLTLRHYFGLSLDQIRADYLGRIYAPGDLGKRWHGGRQAIAMTVVPPAPDVLHTAETVGGSPAHRKVPVFEALPDAATSVETGNADVDVTCTSDGAWSKVSATAARHFTGLRLRRVQPSDPSVRPRLLVVEHPASHHRGDPVTHGEAWLRLVAGTRQMGLVGNAAYAELRLEDVDAAPALLLDTLRNLLTGNAQGARLSQTVPTHARQDYEGRLKAITLPLATDLGYR